MILKSRLDGIRTALDASLLLNTLKVDRLGLEIFSFELVI